MADVSTPVAPDAEGLEQKVNELEVTLQRYRQQEQMKVGKWATGDDNIVDFVSETVSGDTAQKFPELKSDMSELLEWSKSCRSGTADVAKSMGLACFVHCASADAANRRKRMRELEGQVSSLKDEDQTTKLHKKVDDLEGIRAELEQKLQEYQARHSQLEAQMNKIASNTGMSRTDKFNFSVLENRERNAPASEAAAGSSSAVAVPMDTQPTSGCSWLDEIRASSGTVNWNRINGESGSSRGTGPVLEPSVLAALDSIKGRMP
jgi:hypothetical protein